MNDTEVNKTILQMVRFIKQEADEKASEIMVTAEEEFNITKLQLLETERAKVRREFERREGAIEVKRKVEGSKQLNETRLKVLQAREDAMQDILREAQTRLIKLSKDTTAYRALVLGLLVQGLAKLKEPKMVVRCRQVDVALVRELLPEAAQAYARQQGGTPPVLELDTAHPLPPPPSGNESGEEFDTCTGGVVVTSGDGRIVCSNTLDERLRLAYGTNLPAIRTLLFGAADQEH